MGRPGVALDLGCGIGAEVQHLTSSGWSAVGIDISMSALELATARGSTSCFAQADIRQLPVVSQSVDLLLDRGCFHYFQPAHRTKYEAEAWRVLRPGGRFLLRACLNTAGSPNGLDEQVLLDTFARWNVDGLERHDLVSDTRTMPALVTRLETSVKA